MMLGESLPPVSEMPPRIVVVDADPVRRVRLESVFHGEGYEVVTLADGDHVLDMVRQSPPDLVVLDAHLPGISGFELCGDLRMVDEARLTSILVISSLTDEATAVRALLCGADDVCVGPERLGELKARVRVQLRNRRDRWLLQWAKQQRASFRQASRIDPLTQIPNRRAGDEAIAEALTGGPAVLLLIDIDHFKQVNDTYGHVTGDVVLREVAQALANRARQGDTVARFGGEEFVAVIRGARPENAHRIAERFRRAVADMKSDATMGARRVTVSVGAAGWDGTGERPSPETLVIAADDALYQAKRLGRNQVVAWNIRDPRVSSNPDQVYAEQVA